MPPKKGKPESPTESERPTLVRGEATADAHLAATLPQSPGHADSGGVRSAQEERLRPSGFAKRYDIAVSLGVGGMGDVRACRDARVGRDVAIKFLLPEHANQDDLRLRFEREAKIQGRLEHPSIVPVYDLGMREDGSLFFTMKRVRGDTLEQVVKALRIGKRAARTKYSRRRLLTAFSNLCLAIAYAHSRGVIHRDLKPSNVILGDFGEVSVLDWGIAKTLDSEAVEPSPESARGGLSMVMESNEIVDSSPTVAGVLMGTPGYLAPEQVHGDQDAIGAASDVYALGVILFELLALEPFHTAETLNPLIASTLQGPPNPRPSTRRPELQISPELDAICERATAVEPGQRFQTAREVHEEIERYLDGERDLDRRAAQSREHVAHVEKVLAAGREKGVDVEGRTAALLELNTAIALDPANESALALLARVVTEVPDPLPESAERELGLRQAQLRRRSARMGVYGLAAAWLFIPLLMLMGGQLKYIGPFSICLLFATLVTWHTARTGRSDNRRLALSAVALQAVPLTVTVLFGPLILVPSLVLGCAIVLVVNARARRVMRIFIGTVSVTAIALPFLLQQLGLLPQSYAFADGVMQVLPWAAQFQQGPALFVLLLGSSLLIVLALSVTGTTLDALTRAERRQFAQAWQLRQLFPEKVRPQVPMGSEPMT